MYVDKKTLRTAVNTCARGVACTRRPRLRVILQHVCGVGANSGRRARATLRLYGLYVQYRCCVARILRQPYHSVGVLYAAVDSWMTANNNRKWAWVGGPTYELRTLSGVYYRGCSIVSLHVWFLSSPESQ